jgi:alkylation response protein AidB-like acyl-CoA dehydrogenase
MPIAITPEQAQLTQAVAEFAARHAPIDKTRAAFTALAAGELPAWWGDLVAHGFHAVHLPERLGGQGGHLTDTACVVEAAAMALLPGPLLNTITAGAAVQFASDITTHRALSLLSDLAAGATATLVLPDHSDFAATPTGSGWRVNGTSGPTLGMCSAQKVIIPASTPGGETVWFALDSEQSTLRIEPHHGTDLTVDVGTLRLDDHAISDTFVLAGFDDDRARCVAMALMACAASGIIRWCVDAVTAHLRSREQFGRPIGAFQALQHKAAMLLVNSELATAAAWDAVRAADESVDQHELASAAAAVMAVTPAPDLVLEALTMFGAIGFTWEHDLHLYWRRAITLAAAVGPATRWTGRLGTLGRTRTRDIALNLEDVEADFRAGVSDVLDQALPLSNDGPRRQGDYEHFTAGEQRTLIADAGLIAPHWPAPWGIDATPIQQLVIDEEFDRRPGLSRPSVGIAEWVLPTLMNAGTPDLHDRFIKPTLHGELAWCQLFSEPGAGSDLASLVTRAVKVDGGWLVNGHKIWTSSAHRADYGALLARTDPDASKHRGIGYFILDMRTDGVEVQPIKQSSGDADFNEVFLTDVFVPDVMLLGEATDGWGLAIATMAQERVAISGYVKNDRAAVLRQLARDAGPDSAAVLCALGEVVAYASAIKALGVQEMIRLLDGQSAGPASSIAKVAASVMLRRIVALTLEQTGRAAMIADSEPPAVQQYLFAPAELLGGGTREIQLNIIAQMIMGLPRK